MVKNLRKRGFALAELAIIVAIVAILAAILIPTLSGVFKNTPITGEDGLTPSIGENGNWWLGDVDTEVSAEGRDGRDVAFRVASDHIQMQYEGETTWTNLIDITTLVGATGPAGSDGADGRDVKLRVSDGGFIQWQYDGDVAWIDLISLTSLTGADGVDGNNGSDGREVEMRVSAGFIQWRYAGAAAWTDLVSLATLTGADGTDGTDGKEVEMQVASGFIQWRYVGDTVWSDLVSLATLTGPAGSDGADGRDVKLRVSGGFIQWQYDGDVAWTNLVSLSTLTGPAGTDGTDGTDGTNGVGISSITRTSGNGSAGTTDTYTITFTNSTTSTFTVYNGANGTDGTDGTDGNNGTDGTDGVGISSTTITYKTSSSGTFIPTGTWSSNVPSVSKGQYLWTRTVITFTDDTTKTSYSVSYHGLDGTDADVPDWAKNTTLGTTGNPMVIGTTPESNLITSLTMSQLADAMNITGNLPIIYGYSTTSVGVTEKAVGATSSSNPFTGYIKDQIYVVEFYYGNTALSPTIDINGAGAKTVRHLTTGGGTTTIPGTHIFYIQHRCIAVFVYDGTYMIPISCFSRYINASETKMLNYSKAGAISAITTSDSVLSAIGKLEKALDGADAILPDIINFPNQDKVHLQENGTTLLSTFSYGLNANNITPAGRNVFVGNAGNTHMGSTAHSSSYSSYNTAMGYNAFYSNTTGAYNIAIGYNALYENTTGLSNTAIGYNAGRYLTNGITAKTTGNNSVFIGYDSKASANGVSNETVIGYQAVGKGANTVTLGNTNVTKANVGNSELLKKADIPQWTHLGTTPHTEGGIRYYTEDIIEYMVIYTNSSTRKYSDMTEVVYGPPSLIHGMPLPGYVESNIIVTSSYIEIDWNPGSGVGAKSNVIVYAR